MAGPAVLHEDGVPMPRRLLAIGTIALAVAMAVLDTAIANVALPTIARDLAAPPVDAIWVVNAYQLAVTVSLLPLASLGEIYGYRRVYQIGLVVFTAASLLCALSTGLVGLTLARVVQGFGAAGIMSVNTALVRFIYPRRLLGRGIGLNALVVAVSSALGPTIASGILLVGAWQWLFAVNVPLGVVAFLIAARSLPDTKLARHRFDWPSAILCAACFGLLITGIDGAGHGQTGAAVLAEFGFAVLAGGFLVRRQLALAAPLLPIDLLRIPVFALSIGSSICAFAAQALAFVSLPFYFQDTLGLTQVQTGLLMTPWPLTLAVVAPVAGRLADRFSAGLLGGIGLAALCAGLLLMAVLPAHPTEPDICWRMALCGLGFGLFQTPNNRAMIAAAPTARSGGASGMLSTARLFGQSSGAAVVALIFGLASHLATGAAVLTAAGFSAASAAISLLRMWGPARPRPAE